MRSKIFLFISLLCLGFKSLGQFKSVTIGIDGLTCSMCSNIVERQILQLSFIDKVEMDLNENQAKLTFVPNIKVEINEIAEKVIDAGYSLRYLKASYNFESFHAENNTSFTFENDIYTFINGKESILNGCKEIQFLGKNYLSKKDYKKWSSLIPSVKKNKKSHTYFITF